ncbi:MAG: hypothetical protein GY953_05090 [bacterium]|nr:hypothetical protein [bacterium]
MGKLHWIGGLVLSAQWLVFAQGVTIHVYDYADVPRRVVEEAQGHATTIFETAGIDVTWVRGQHAKRNANSVVLRLLPVKMMLATSAWTNDLGYALQPAGGRYGYVAGVYVSRVRHRAIRMGRPLPLALGVVMAHEVGHLLLGADSHSRSGVMRSELTKHSIRLAAKGKLTFSEEQLKRIRARYPGSVEVLDEVEVAGRFVQPGEE